MKSFNKAPKLAKPGHEQGHGLSYAKNSGTTAPAGHKFAASCGLETESAPFTTVTSAFYAHCRVLGSSEIAVWDLTKNKRGSKITYQDLAARVLAVSQHLDNKGVRKGDKIPLIATRGLESVVGILAILSCGAQFVPVDYERQTANYIQAVVEWSGQNVVLSVSSAADDVLNRLFPNNLEVVRVYLEGSRPLHLTSNATKFDQQASADDICYTVFTSEVPPSDLLLRGGREVRVRHKSIVNLACLRPGTLGIRRGLAVSQLQSIASNLAPWEIFGCLCNGGTLIIGGDEPGPAFQKIQVLITTPTLLSTYKPAQFPRLEVVAAVGEALSDYSADLWAGQVREFWNCYGSAETTIVSTMSLHARLDDHSHESCGTGTLTSGCPLLTGRDGLAPIGNLIPNTYLYVLDDELQHRPMGFVGSIWVGGISVTHDNVGYNTQSYALNPFLNDGTYIYRTGDYGFCKKDGSVALSTPYTYQTEDHGSSKKESRTPRSTPIPVPVYDGHDLSPVDLQRLRSSLHCAASCMVDAPPVAVWAFGLEIHCFVVVQPGYDFGQIQLKIEEALEWHVNFLRGNKMFPKRPYISGVHPLERMPIGNNGKLNSKELQRQVRNSTSTKPLKNGGVVPATPVTPNLPLSPSTLLKSEFDRSETGSVELHSQTFLHRVRTRFSGHSLNCFTAESKT